MEKTNKLIAEFMGAEKTHIKSVGDIYCPVPSKNGSEYADKLQYHISWDWLMPVVQKIGDEYLNTPFDETYSHLTEQYENIWTIEDTYRAVVEFIKENNQNN